MWLPKVAEQFDNKINNERNMFKAIYGYLSLSSEKERGGVGVKGGTSGLRGFKFSNLTSLMRNDTEA